MAVHGNAIEGDRHPSHNNTFADLTARNAKTDFTSADVGKDCRVGSDGAGYDFYKITKVTAGVATWVQVGGSSGGTLASEGALINSATSKATPVDADYLGLMDSAASNILKKLSWANLKATLKTYFDTLYATTAQANATHTGDATGATTLTVVKINGTSLAGLSTGILKNTTGTGVPSIAVAGDFPTLNQSTTGTASNVSGTVAIANGGTGQTTQQAAINALTAVSDATNEYVLTKDTATGNAVFKASGGGSSLTGSTTSYNTSLGVGALHSNSGAIDVVAIGINAGYSTVYGGSNVFVGNQAGLLNTNGYANVFIGQDSGYYNTDGYFNVYIGCNTGLLPNNGNKNWNTFVGALAGYVTSVYSNVTCLGSNSQVTGDNQVQLGDSATTTYAYGAVQNRSDERDKADIRDITLGLEFINRLRPVDARWDMREDYRPPMPVKPDYPTKPATIQIRKQVKKLNEVDPNIPADYTIEDDLVVFFVQGIKVRLSLSTYSDCFESADVFEKEADGIAWQESCKIIDDNYEATILARAEASKLENITHDGTHKRSRYHHFLIAQEVKAVMEDMGVDFAGYQDHKLNGGDDVLSIGYAELIPVLIKAVQELTARLVALEG